MSLISIVVPTHNEIANVEPLYHRLVTVFDGLPGYDFELIFSDDSTDSTPQKIAAMRAEDSRIKLVRLSRRFGQAIAVSAGIDRASGDALIMMDADLQDPPESIVLLLEQWRKGYEIVYVQRSSGSTYALYKLFSFLFYRLLRKISSVDIPVDAGEFRLLDRKVVEYLRRLTEHTRYLRGLTILPGFRQIGIQIQRADRQHGQTNYNFRRSMLVAIDGILSFSALPLRLASLLGALTTLSSFMMAVVYTVWKIINPSIMGPGWAGIMVSIMFFGGCQLLALGILGEYIARVFVEVQNRPVYWIDYELGFNETEVQQSAAVGSRQYRSRL